MKFLQEKKLERAVKKKDISIELLRVYACLMVIWAHIQIDYLVGGKINQTSFIIKCLIGDNVPIFLVILGFYMFNGLSGSAADRVSQIPGAYLHKLKGFLIKVYVPTLIVTLLACFAGEFFYRHKTFVQLFTQFQMNWEYLKNYVILQQPSDMVGQFWYIVVYIKLLAFFPVLAFLCYDNQQYNRLRRVYIFLSLLNIVLKDIGFLRETAMLTISNYVFDCHFLYVLLGYEAALFFKKTTWSKAQQVMFGAALFLCGAGLRYGLTMYSFQKFGIASNSYFMGLECAPSYLSSVGCLLIFYSVLRDRHSRVIGFIGSLTFYIFMVHGMMLRYFAEIGEKILASSDYGSTGLMSLKYYFGYGAVIFFTSLAFGLLIKLCYDGIILGANRLLKLFRAAKR